ncbi:MAG: hypothetical protein WBM83_09655, partial [Flavobacteriaceae bacterium]
MRLSHIVIPLLLILILDGSLCCKKNEGYQFNKSPNIKENLQEGEGPVADGCPNTQYDDWKTSRYVLPYPVGESYIVTLSHCGGSYHSEGQPDEYAIDFSMKIGTLITVSRAG